MRKISSIALSTALGLGLWGLAPTVSVLTQAHAAQVTVQTPAPTPLATPHTVQLSRQSARLHVQSKAQVSVLDGEKVLTIPLPQDAQDIMPTLAAPHDTMLHAWRVEDAESLPPQGAVGRQKAALLARKDQLQGEGSALQGRIRLLLTPALSASFTPQEDEGLRRREEALRTLVPALTKDLAAVEREIKDVDQRLASLPDTGRRALKLVLTVDQALPEGTPVSVNYAYTLNTCSWQPHYSIEALPAKDTVRMRLMADIQQFSGMDWSKTKVELSDTATARREPNALYPWLVRKGTVPVARAKAEMAPSLMSVAAKAKPLLAPKDNAAPQMINDPALATWGLPMALSWPEGRSTLTLQEITWDTPLQRIARPGQGDNRVWLSARLPLQDKALPAGEALFLMDGVSVGKGNFTPRNDEVRIFFGTDPLVTVKNEPDTRKSGKSGVVNKRQTWNWGWTYTVFNQRDNEVTVRIEEPATQTGDTGIEVNYNDSPAASTGPDHSLWWDVQTPARGQAQIRRNITVTAPQDMELSPGR